MTITSGASAPAGRALAFDTRQLGAIGGIVIPRTGIPSNTKTITNYPSCIFSKVVIKITLNICHIALACKVDVLGAVRVKHIYHI